MTKQTSFFSLNELSGLSIEIYFLVKAYRTFCALFDRLFRTQGFKIVNNAIGYDMLVEAKEVTK